MNNSKKYSLVFLLENEKLIHPIQKLGFNPDQIILETEYNQENQETLKPLKNELPSEYVKRLAASKAEFLRDLNKKANEQQDSTGQQQESIFISFSVLNACGKRFLLPPKTKEEALRQLNLISGRRHRIHCAICVLTSSGKKHLRHNFSIVKFKKLDSAEIKNHAKLENWKESYFSVYDLKSSGAAFVNFFSGCHSCASYGLPLFDLSQILKQYLF